MFASMKYVGTERGFFWALWSTRSFAQGYCLDCGFAPDLAAALSAIRSAPCAHRQHLQLLVATVAAIFFSFVWDGERVDQPIILTAEDRLYEAERLSFCINSPPGPPRSTSGFVGQVLTHDPDLMAHRPWTRTAMWPRER